jgi:uncharacterized circularly permuted ATP-grasp superfamily protein/uncharacterized alpha-E superfamily protein
MTAQPPPQSGLGTYIPDEHRYDELLDQKGLVRTHWQPLVRRLTGTGARDVARRGLELTRRLIIENGVTYNVYADPQGADRPWSLDPLPLVLQAAEWSAIEKGVMQRARVLDALLADLYGPQRLLAEGIVPPELPFGHPNFLWPCHGFSPRGGTRLHVYAADLARAPDGRWWILADRTQAPSGAGYALENREIVEQVLPEPIREMGVRRVRGFFGELRERMLSFVDADENALAVILTPGPLNETYFEHAYLARQFGVPLVEGNELTVRNDTVYLKTLAGLRRVHAILRRLDDDFCDPVELRGDSALGVPGLIGAARAGRVVLANALGTGVLESAAWHGFLPGVADRLLGESLTLSTVATWWCGERPALDYVLANLDHLVLKPTYPNQNFEPVFGRVLANEAREAVVRRLRARPYAYVAQEHLSLSQAPVWRPNGAPGFAAKALTIRVYAIATPDGYRVMPGGLARVATDAAVDVVSTQRGGGSKDIWVLSERDAVEPASVGASSAQPAIRHDYIPSRLVENLFWLGRYNVRCADKARLLRSTVAARIDKSVWEHAVQICGALGVILEGEDPGASLRTDRNPNGISADVRRLAWSASQVRTRLSGRYWRAVVGLQRQMQEAAASREAPREALERLLFSLSALTGIATEDMTHDEGWRLMRVGRRLERLQFVAGLLSEHLLSVRPSGQGQVEWLLEACDSISVYRARYAVAPRLGPALDLLVCDAEHPRSLTFQWNAMARDLQELAGALGQQREEGLDHPLPVLDDEALFALELETANVAAARKALATQLHELGSTAAQLSDRLSRRHFSHTMNALSI